MKNAILITLFTTLLLSSCNPDKNSAIDSKGRAVTSKFTKEIILPKNLCGLITIDMITNYFKVQKEDLDLEEDYLKCGYSWEKANFEELRERQINMVFNYVKKEAGRSFNEENDNSEAISDVIQSESPYNIIQVGKFEKYNNLQEAVDQFTLLHRMPTKEELEKLQKEMKKQLEYLNKKQLKDAEKLTLGIPTNLKFKEIEGIGDQAYYDYFDKSLDVRFGIITFKVYIDSEKNLETNINIAKALAKAIWENL